jgi:hypothetical protein
MEPNPGYYFYLCVELQPMYLEKKEENKLESKVNPNSNMSYPKLYLNKCFCVQFEVIFVVERVSV